MSFLISTNITEFQLHWWWPEFEQESDSQIWKNSGPGFKNFGTGAESESENVTPATSGLGSGHTENLKNASCPASCSAVDKCKWKLHTRCCHWPATWSAASSATVALALRLTLVCPGANVSVVFVFLGHDDVFRLVHLWSVLEISDKRAVIMWRTLYVIRAHKTIHSRKSQVWLKTQKSNSGSAFKHVFISSANLLINLGY